MARRGVYGCAFPLLNDMIAPYLVTSANAEQRARWFPGLCAGTTIAAIAMTEPGAGSDLQGITTRAVDEGDHVVLTGQKTFISNGILADLVVVVARTDPDAGHDGISLVVVERGMAGFERGRNLHKIGQHAQDTAELFFDQVRVPKANLLGEPGTGFAQLMTNLAQERLSIAVSAAATCESLVEASLTHVKERTAFGRPIGSFQHTRFALAEMATETRVARVFVDDCVARHVRGELDTATASMAKWWTTELTNRIVDRAVQLHGGYGYLSEHPVARAFVNARVQTIYGGTTEIQKEIIGRSLGL
jgi:alkylation response protein AidB-like acyl-CoA dehydrogenase